MAFRTLQEESFGRDDAPVLAADAAQATFDRNNRLFAGLAAAAALLAVTAAIALSFI